ncbi:MAG: hypothetical protein ACI37U_07435 [Bacteroides sp.]
MKTCRLFDWKHLWVLLLISLFAVSCVDDYYDGLFEGNKKKLEELLNNSQYAVERIDIRCYVDDAYTQISVDRNAVQLAEHFYRKVTLPPMPKSSVAVAIPRA